MSEATRILSAIERGDPQAADRLLPLVYEELRRLAARMLHEERPGQTLQPTALVHEAYIRLMQCEPDQQWDGRRHFFAAAAEAMRRILIDIARRKQRPKHGGGHCRIELAEADLTTVVPLEELLALNEALDDLAAVDPVKADLVKLRYFGGMTLEEAADSLGISRATAARNWTYARAWLFDRIRAGDDA